MAPIEKRTSAPSECSTTGNQPSTWAVLTALGGAVWATYTVFEMASSIWHWIQRKLEQKSREKLKASQKNTSLQKRELQKRIPTPFNAVVNVIHWVTMVVRWIYYRLDNIPHRIQDAVNRDFIKEQDKEWDIKQEEADRKVKMVLASQFPSIYKKDYLDPYEEGSELYDENLELLKRVRDIKRVEEVIMVTAKW